MIYLIGRSVNDIASSEYLYSYHGIKASPAPYFNLDEEFEMQQTLRTLIEKELVVSAHDVSDGGLFIALLESAMPNGLGFDITTDAEVRTDAFLFGEAQGRVVVSVSQHREAQFLDYMSAQKVPFAALGHVTKSEIRVDDAAYGFVEDFRQTYLTAIERIIEG